MDITLFYNTRNSNKITPIFNFLRVSNIRILLKIKSLLFCKFRAIKILLYLFRKRGLTIIKKYVIIYSD